MNAGRKRSGTQYISDLGDDDVLGKRARTTPNVSQGSAQELSKDQHKDNGPVQQLVAMFGALVAQGEKAAGSLEILVSSISSDLLAEVVMANIRHLPPTRPKAEEDEQEAGSDTQFKHLSSYLTDILSTSITLSQTDTVLDAQPSASDDLEVG